MAAAARRCRWWRRGSCPTALGRKITGQPLAGPGLPSGWSQHLVFDVAYLPLPAWGPLLALVTVAYYRRRRAPATALAQLGPAGRAADTGQSSGSARPVR